MVSQIYYAEHEKYLVNLIGSECSGWYGYLAKFIVLSQEDSDMRLLDLAMDGLGTDEMALIEFLCARPPARVRPTLNPNPNPNPDTYPKPNANPYPNP